jgi:nicotinamidase-related amidase
MRVNIHQGSLIGTILLRRINLEMEFLMMNSETAFVIIDTQVGLIEPAYQGQEVLSRIAMLLEKARATHTPIIYVQHDAPRGDVLEVGTPNWQIHPAIAPHLDEPIVRKRASDAFYETTLQQELEARGIRHLVVVGGQTEYCVDTTVRRATTCGYEVTLVADAHTTYDNEHLTAAQSIAYHNYVLDGFASGECAIQVKPASAITFP